MIKNINKKGVSAVVATVLIILITVAAVTIIWAAIIPLVSNQLDKSDACLNAVKDLSIGAQGYTCYDEDPLSRKLDVQVKRGANDFDLEDIQFVVDFSGDSIEITPNAGTTHPGSNSASVYTFSFGANIPSGVPSSISIAPVIKLGNSEETCEIAATMTNIPNCIA